MSRFTVFLLAAFLVACSEPGDAEGESEPRWKHLISRSLVTTDGDRFTYEDHALCKFKDPSSGQEVRLQFSSNAVAPADGTISRDVLVSWIAILETKALQKVAGTATYRCQVLDAPIGEADIELSIQMTAEGIQAEVHNRQSGERRRTTQAWPDVYAD